MNDLKSKKVLITGASSGIGKACAVEFAKQGSDLLLAARRMERLSILSEQLETDYKIKTKSVQLDVRSAEQVTSVYTSLEKEWQSIDIIVNNAGLARGFSKLYEGDINQWNEMIDTNLKGMLFVTRTFTEHMINKKKGHVINIGSTAGHEVYPFGNVYAATKFAVKALSQSLRVDVLDKGIKVTSIDPGMVLTEFSNVRFSGDEQRAQKVYEGIEPLTAQDVADTIIFAATRPPNVNINQIILTPLYQASSTQVHRE